jgi:gliding motility-associated protein GldM
VSATDTTQKPVITVGETVLPVDDAGRGIYRVRATTTGTRKWGGIVALKAPDGTILNYPFESSYFVAEPNVVVSPTAVNVMYAGIDNPIDISVPGVTPDKIRVKVTNGSVRQGRVRNPKGQNFPGNWIVKPNTAGQNVQVIVSADMPGRPQTFAPYEFRVKPIPPPIAVFGNRSTGSISRAVAAAQTGVYAIQPDFDFDLTYTITGFTVLYSDSRGDFEESSTSSNLTARQKDFINRLTRGKNLIIKDIRAQGPDGRTMELLPVILKID